MADKIVRTLSLVIGLIFIGLVAYGGIALLNALPKSSDMDKMSDMLERHGIEVCIGCYSGGEETWGVEEAECPVLITYKDGREICVTRDGAKLLTLN